MLTNFNMYSCWAGCKCYSEINNRNQQELYRYCANTGSIWNAFGIWSKTHINEINDRSQQECHRCCANTSPHGMPLEYGAAKLTLHDGLSAAWWPVCDYLGKIWGGYNSWWLKNCTMINIWLQYLSWCFLMFNCTVWFHPILIWTLHMWLVIQEWKLGVLAIMAASYSPIKDHC